MQLCVPTQAMLMEWEGQKLNLVPGLWPRVPAEHKLVKTHPHLFEVIEVTPGFEVAERPARKPQGAKAGASA